MNHSAVNSFFDMRQIAYALTDRALIVQEVGGKTELLDADMEDLVGSPLATTIPELIGTEDALKSILTNSTPDFQLPLMHRDEPGVSLRYYNHSVIPQKDDAGNIVGLSYFVEDVTELGVSEQHLTQQRNELVLLRDRMSKQHLELQAVNIELQKLDEVKSQFVSVAAHELRTPLASIMGYAELIIETYAEAFDDKQAHFLHVIQRSADRLLTITNNLLDVTRIETGRVELVLQSVDLQLVVSNVLDELKPILDAKRQQIDVTVEDEIPRALCDDGRVAQIVTKSGQQRQQIYRRRRRHLDPFATRSGRGVRSGRRS